MNTIVNSTLPSEHAVFVGALVMTRALQSFQAIILLCEKGMITEARTLLRCCCESAIAISKIATDIKFVDVLIGAHTKQQATFAKVMLKDTATQETDSDQIHKKEVLEKLISDYETNKPSGINWEQAARESQVEGLYDLVYRLSSNDSVHVSINALNRHVNQEDSNIILFGPHDNELEETLVLAMGSISQGMMAFGRLLQRDDIEECGSTDLNRIAEFIQA